MTKQRNLQTLLSLLFSMVFLLAAISPAAAQTSTPSASSPLQIAAQTDSVSLQWAVAAQEAATPADLSKWLSVQRYQGYDLPMQTVALYYSRTEMKPLINVSSVSALAIDPLLVQPGAPLEAPVANQDGSPAPVLQETVALPQAPIFLVRRVSMGGGHLVVMAFSPIYEAGGVVSLAQQLAVTFPGAQLVGDDRHQFVTDAAVRKASMVTAADFSALAAPINPAALSAKAKIIVSKPGLQVVSASTLTPFGINLALDAPRLKLTTASSSTDQTQWTLSETPLHIVGNELRFYAPSAGDRWNITTTYYLSLEDGPRARMATRSVTAGAAGDASVVAERGKWMQPKSYQSLYVGSDGDHWFAKDIKSDPDQAGQVRVQESNSVTATLYMTTSVQPANTLPLVSGSTTFTVTFTSYMAQTRPLNDASQPLYTLRLRQPAGPDRTVFIDVRDPSDPSRKKWLENVHHRFTLPDNPQKLVITLMPEDYRAGMMIDYLEFERLVRLQPQSGSGAIFSARSGQSTFAWTNVAAPAAAAGLYDITDPLQPIQLSGANATGFADSVLGRSYLLAGVGTRFTPAVSANTPFNFATFGGAQEIFIVPNAEYAAALQPLVTYRRSSQGGGYSVSVVAASTIYDNWSFGQVSAYAIRTFLQYAYGRPTKPLAAVLVGDATLDPWNNEQREQATILIPAYFEVTDPFIGEAACDSCFGQVDGADPNTGDDDPGTPNEIEFAPEIMIGRFPIKSPAELSTVVDKILRYETATNLSAIWRGRAVFLADNPRRVELDGNGKIRNVYRDPAGDFTETSDRVGDIDPRFPGALTERVYFDPAKFIPETKVVIDASGRPVQRVFDYSRDSWREPDPALARQRAIAALGRGAGLVFYNGHANHFNLASTEMSPPNTNLLMLYDELGMNNLDRLFIQLSMTCLSAQFTKPTNSGTVFDERMFLHPNGGAVAVWGPSGLSVVNGHDLLQKGFMELLVKSRPFTLRMGDLIEAGRTDLVMEGAGNFTDVLRTFQLFGDPLMKVMVNPTINPIYLPLISVK